MEKAGRKRIRKLNAERRDIGWKNVIGRLKKIESLRSR